MQLRSGVYYDARRGKYVTALNEMMGFRKYQKVEEDVRRSLLECLAFFPLKISSLPATGGQVSEKSIRNYLREVEIPEPAEAEEKRKCAVLYVHIDEGHCSTQPKAKRRHSSQIPVAVVTEGVVQERKGRSRNIRPYIIVDPGCSTGELEKRIAAYIFKTYDVSVLTQINVIGDGAQSIRKAIDDWFPGLTKHYMDRFHLMRAVNALNSLRPDAKGASKPAKKICETLRKNDRKAAEAELQALTAFASAKGQKEKLARISSFILNCWEPNVHTMEKGSPPSCTEAAVWHVIAKRQTSECMAWRKSSMGKLAALRAYIMNGGSLRDMDAQCERSGHYKDFLEKILDLPDHLSFDIFAPVREAPVYDSGTQHLIKMISTGGQLFGKQGIRRVS